MVVDLWLQGAEAPAVSCAGVYYASGIAEAVAQIQREKLVNRVVQEWRLDKRIAATKQGLT